MTSLLTLPQSNGSSPSVRARAFVCEDPQSRELLTRIEHLAPSDGVVLIVGETGTGKEILARHIHRLSPRAHRPFVALNCGAVSQSVIEADLFGDAADGGSLYLDEIGDLPLITQAKLVRVLQEMDDTRLGSWRSVPSDVRIIAATNTGLEEAVAAGRFREDLYHRLTVAQVVVSALRDRPGDILPLARYFVRLYWFRLGHEMTTDIPILTSAAERYLLDHPWMGNIRELDDAIHHALLVCHGGRITPDDLPLLRMPSRNGRLTESEVPARSKSEGRSPPTTSG